MTGAEVIALYLGKVLGFADLSTRFVDVLLAELHQHQADLFGGGGTIEEGSGRLSWGYSSSTVTFAGDRHGWTGTGYRLFADVSEDEWQAVPFANSGATVYYLGARWNDEPGGVELGADGAIHYSHWIEAVGEVGPPDTATDNGDGTITLCVDTLVAPGWTVADTRPAVVWLETPETVGADAIYEGVLAYHAGSGEVRITVPHALGQDAISTTAADYRVLVRGPTISTSDLSAVENYWFLGTVTSGACDNTAQALLNPFGVTAGAFSVQHGTTGKHTTIEATGTIGYDSGSEPSIVAHYSAEDLFAYSHTVEILGGAPSVDFTPYAVGVDRAYVSLGADVSGDVYLYLPLDLPEGAVLTSWAVTALRVGAGSIVEVDVLRADFSSGARALMDAGWSVLAAGSPGSGFVVTSANPPDTDVTRAAASKLVLRIHLKNDGSTIDTACFAGLTINGYTSKVAHGAAATLY